MTEEEVDAYIRLLTAVEKLENPNIVKMFGMYKDDNYLHLVTEH